MLFGGCMQILKMDNQGRGITYYNNKIVFVNNTLPNEDVNIKIILDKKRYSIANVDKYNKISKIRIKPKCKYYDVCGGCQLQHLSYKNELNYKTNYLNNIFKSLNIKISRIISDKDYNYRNKITMKTNNMKTGFNKINTNEIINIDKCLIADNNINKNIKYLNKINLNNIKEIIIKSFNGKDMLVLNGNKNININNIKKYFDAIYINDKLVSGNKIIAKISNIKYYIAPNAFFQVNMNIAHKMFEYIKDICRKRNAKQVIDLYCGCGSISLYIANSVKYVYGVELNKESIKDANLNKELNEISNVDFICDTTDNITDIDKYDTIIVDPPRSGLSKKVIKIILNSNAKNLIYVSCDPITLKRDLLLLEKKYVIENITTFDMFPNTYHVENVCTLSLK